jgi:hypothetical protein
VVILLACIRDIPDLRYQLLWVMFLMVFLSPSSKCLGGTSIRLWSFPYVSFHCITHQSSYCLTLCNPRYQLYH